MRSVFNIDINGDLYIKGFLEADLLPSQGDRRNVSRYEEVIEDMLKGFWNKFTTSQVLSAIRLRTPKKITISPFSLPKLLPAEENLLKNNSPLPESQKNTMTILKASRINAGVVPDSYPDSENFGKGSNATLFFNPGVYGDAGGNAPLSPGIYSDEMLVHELTHAMSVLEGSLAKNIPFQTPFGELMKTSYGDLEEFTAMVIANMYRSEMGRPRLRKSYSPVFWEDGLKDGGVDASGGEFYRFFQKDMQQICRIHPVLSRNLKQGASIPFNPFVYCQM